MACDTMNPVFEVMDRAWEELFEGNGGLEMMSLMLAGSLPPSQEEASDVSEWDDRLLAAYLEMISLMLAGSLPPSQEEASDVSEWDDRLLAAYIKANQNKKLLAIRHRYNTSFAITCDEELIEVLEHYGIVTMSSSDNKDGWTLKVDARYDMDDVQRILDILSEGKA